MSLRTLKAYYSLAKPGIIRGNIMTTVAGFLFASSDSLNLSKLLLATFGVGLVIASGCVANNVLDLKIDQKMSRTQKRPLASGAIGVRPAIIYSFLLGILGFAVLGVSTNLLTVAVGIVGWLDYVAAYGYFKRTSVHGTLVGGISGSTPIVAGYTAATGQLGFAAAILFLIMFVWQMPHFYAIAMFRKGDYSAANLPVISITKGMDTTKRYILAYVLAYALLAPLLTIAGYAGISYFVVMAVVSLYWIWVGLKTPYKEKPNKWAGKMFGISLLALVVFSITIALNNYLP